MISPLVLSGDITDCHDCGRVPCIWWPEARDTAGHPPVHSTAPPPQRRMIWPQMSIGLRLRNPGLGPVVNTWRGLKSGCVTGWFLTLLRWGAGMGLWTSMSRYGAAKFSWNWAEQTSAESIQMIRWKLLIHWFAKLFLFFLPSDTKNFFLYWIILTKFLLLLWEKALLSLCWLFFFFHPKNRVTLRPYCLRIEKRSCL